MVSMIENIAVAAIVIAILGKTFYSLYQTYKALKTAQTDSAHKTSLSLPVCTGSCGSCRACSNSRQVKIS